MSKPETKFVVPKFFATAEGLAMLRAMLAQKAEKETVQAVARHRRLPQTVQSKVRRKHMNAYARYARYSKNKTVSLMNWRAELRDIESTIPAYQARAASLRKSIKALEADEVKARK
jgi:hypothetical protein